MNELERRKVMVVKPSPSGVFTMKHYNIKVDESVESSTYARGFALFNASDEIIAFSRSDHALSDWAFKNGAIKIVYNYDLRDGDDGR